MTCGTAVTEPDLASSDEEGEKPPRYSISCVRVLSTVAGGCYPDISILGSILLVFKVGIRVVFIGMTWCEEMKSQTASLDVAQGVTTSSIECCCCERVSPLFACALLGLPMKFESRASGCFLGLSHPNKEQSLEF